MAPENDTTHPLITQDNCILEGNYDGYLIIHPSGISAYKQLPTVEDCQALCQTLDSCLFFNYYEGIKECELKYGVGTKVTDPSRLRGTKQLFGPKNCPGGNLLNIVLIYHRSHYQYPYFDFSNLHK